MTHALVAVVKNIRSAMAHKWEYNEAMPMEGNLNNNKSGSEEEKEEREMLFLPRKHKILQKIVDSMNQFIAISISGNFVDAKSAIKKSAFKKLEEFLPDFSKEDLEKSYPGIVEKFNSLVEKMKDESLTEEEFIKLKEEIRDLVNKLNNESQETWLKLMQ